MAGTITTIDENTEAVGAWVAADGDFSIGIEHLVAQKATTICWNTPEQDHLGGCELSVNFVGKKAQLQYVNGDGEIALKNVSAAVVYRHFLCMLRNLKAEVVGD